MGWYGSGMGLMLGDPWEPLAGAVGADRALATTAPAHLDVRLGTTLGTSLGFVGHGTDRSGSS